MSGASYDPGARRDTPLALKLKERILRDGPITVEQYMTACLYDPEHGYYVHRPAIGAAGDFITAPEISQIFGELIGLWCAAVWRQMGAPKVFNLIELGPGRGTLMKDMLRATRHATGFHTAVRVTLIESNVLLRDAQAKTLGETGFDIRWQPGIDASARTEGLAIPTIIIGNEYLDCQPKKQFVRLSEGWVERRVHINGLGKLDFCLNDPFDYPAVAWGPHVTQPVFPQARDGDIIETGRAEGMIDLAMSPWPRAAALLIDYGHTEPLTGDTLQTVRNHRYEHPLTSPGEADLTMHVDFAALGHGAHVGSKLAIDGPTTQAEFLGSLGIMERASRLMAANPAKAAQIEAGVARLMSPTGMGSRFKAIGLRSPHLPPLPGFPVVDKSRSSP